MNYLILITEESKPVLVEPVDGSEFKFYQFKDEAFAMELVRKLSNNENDFFGVGQTFPLPDNIIVSFEYLCNCQLQTLRGTPTMCFTCLRPGEHKLAILSKLEEEKKEPVFNPHLVCGPSPKKFTNSQKIRLAEKLQEKKGKMTDAQRIDMEYVMTGKPVVAPSEEVKQKWINVKDRLPEEGKKVFIMDNLVEYPDNTWTGIYYGDGIWHRSERITPYSDGQVTHWMPLPAKVLE